MTTINHPNIIAYDREVEWKDGQWSHNVTVITDLSTNAYEASYDAKALHDLVRFVAQEMAKHEEGFHSITLRSHLSYVAQHLTEPQAAE